MKKRTARCAMQGASIIMPGPCTVTARALGTITGGTTGGSMLLGVFFFGFCCRYWPYFSAAEF